MFVHFVEILNEAELELVVWLKGIMPMTVIVV